MAASIPLIFDKTIASIICIEEYINDSAQSGVRRPWSYYFPTNTVSLRARVSAT